LDSNGQDWILTDVTEWTDQEISIASLVGSDGQFTLQPGDTIELRVWNPQTEAGPAPYTFSMPPR
jgi:hypothetical protein